MREAMNISDTPQPTMMRIASQTCWYCIPHPRIMIERKACAAQVVGRAIDNQDIQPGIFIPIKR